MNKRHSLSPLIAGTAAAAYNAAIDHCVNLERERAARLKTERDAAHDMWAQRGGCEKCHGRGRVVIWDTLDCMDGSCADFGACPMGESCTARTLGPDPGHSSRYDRWMGVADTFVPSQTLVDLERACESARLARRAAQVASRPTYGKKVRVVRGRKVPVGLEGEIIWVGRGYNDGTRVGIRDIQGTVHWTDAGNVAVL